MGATWAKDFARHNTCVAAIAPGGGYCMAMVKAMPNKSLDKLRAKAASGIEHFGELLNGPRSEHR
ncbi:hypothetical protein PRZ61_04630 [Halomonas pacifica]|uniref:hypothetical protein n=1 Tax=Bisbaumannia pacifica TaxID=77098 RepID=UPI0023590A1F|nr:hypothetical protein [Halomonas pacifica]MDC8802731.1 hypothetical protein [Halomonas pacifica]